MTDFQARLQRALDAGFQIDRELGGGGMSRVFLATERALQRRVVVKVLPPDLAAGVNVERFRREIQLAAQLQHPHIVPVLAAGDDDALLWYTMPYIEGESLRGALKRQNRLPVRDVVRILHDVVDALAYAHARGIVHRDIKPDNILTSGMHALVTDFGVAKALSAAIPQAGGTTTGMAIGTPAYMAPEQLAADPAADHRVDLYAVGLLGYELLTGTTPFTGSSPQATLAAQLTVTPPAPHLTLTDVPEALSRVIMHCLEKDAGKRPASAQALLAEMDAIPPLSGRAGVESPRSSLRRWPFVVTAALLLAASLTVAQRIRTAGRSDSAGASADSLRMEAGRSGNMGRPDTPGGRYTEAARRTGATAPENGAAFRDSALGAEATDGARAIAVPVTLSRAESLAIMQVMLKRVTAQEATAKRADSSTTTSAGISAAGNAPSASKGVARILVRSTEDPNTEVAFDREVFLNEVKRIFTDSMTQALARMETEMARLPRQMRVDASAFMPPGPLPNAPPGTPSGGLSGSPANAQGGKNALTFMVPLLAPPADGRTRVVISGFTNATGKREFSSLGRDAAAFLRSALASEKYEVVDNELTDRASARTGADRISLGWGLRADFVVSGVISQRADSLVVMTILTDVRGGRFTRVVESTAPVADIKRAYDPALVKLNVWLDSARAFMTRRPPPPSRPPGTP